MLKLEIATVGKDYLIPVFDTVSFRRIVQKEVRRIWKEIGRTILFVTHSIEEAVAGGTTLVMVSARPSRVHQPIRNDGRVERGKPIDDPNTMIMEEVLRQQGEAPLG